MRLWSLHPKHLDAKGLVALWREALLAQKVLLGGTRGYRNHPQLDRFKAASNPADAIGAYLRVVFAESRRRGYAFSGEKIIRGKRAGKIPVTRGQVEYEWAHLRRKLKERAPDVLAGLRPIAFPEIHPCFRLKEGAVEAWERATVEKTSTPASRTF
jgi:hypothetical protein